MSTFLSINNYFYRRGGAEVVFLEHNRLMAGAGWRVVPFSMAHPKNEPSQWSKYFVDELEYGTDHPVPAKVARAIKSVYSLEARRKLGQLIDEVRPDLAHGHNIYHHLSPSILSLLRSRDIPVVLTLHDLKIACPAYSMLAPDGVCERCKGGRFYNVLVHRCMKNSLALSGLVMLEAIVHSLLGSYTKNVNTFVVPSRFYQDKFVEWGFSADRFVHVPNFVDAEAHAPSFSPGKGFVYFGRLSREKGVETLIKAAERTGSQLTLIGTGPMENRLRALVDEIGANVRFAGFLTGETLDAAIRSARAVVLPSECFENAPLAILESYALGKPVIGARIGGIPELVIEGQTGMTFESGNVDSLAESLENFAAKPDIDIEEMGRVARSWVEEGFSKFKYIDSMQRIYSGLARGI